MKFKIEDNQTILSIKDRFGNAEKFYDDRFGDIYVLQDSMGIVGFVRASSWETAYEIAEDELFYEADETIEELKAEYDFELKEHKIIFDSANETEREAVYPADYPNGRLSPSLRFLRWETSKTAKEDSFADNPIFQENYGFRPNGKNKTDKIGHGIYRKDLNGEALNLLTVELVKELELSIELETEQENDNDD